MNKKILKVVGVIVAFVLCFPLHFLYDKFPNFITSIFAPVNESIWEHMKILFGSIITAGIIQKIIMLLKKEKINNICFSNFIGAISSIPIFLIMFLPIYNIIGENMIVIITIMFIAIVISEIISYVIMNKRDYKMENKTIFLALIVYMIFLVLTYYPLEINLFLDKKELIYGIKK